MPKCENGKDVKVHRELSGQVSAHNSSPGPRPTSESIDADSGIPA